MEEELSYSQLMDYIRSVSESGENIEKFREEILENLRRYKADRRDYKEFVAFDEKCFTKNLVEHFGSSCNIIIFCWAPKQRSSIHSHGGSKCHVKILEGQLEELQLARPDERVKSVQVDLSREKATVLKANEVTYIDDSIGAHLVSNKSSLEAAISLHIYWPAYKTTRVYRALSEETKIVELSNERSEDIELEFYNQAKE